MAVPTLSFWTNLLRLPDYEVVYCQEEADLQQYRMTVASKQPIAVCPHCGKVSETIHQTKFPSPTHGAAATKHECSRTVTSNAIRTAVIYHFTAPSCAPPGLGKRQLRG